MQQTNFSNRSQSYSYGIFLWSYTLHLPMNVAKRMDRMNGNNNLGKVEPHWRLVQQIVVPANMTETLW